MRAIDNIKAIPGHQKFRYAIIILSCSLFFAPFLFLPSLVDNPDLCGKLCMRRFYLIFPGMDPQDVANNIQVASIGVYVFTTIMMTTFFYGRMWCSYVCPVGGFPEMVSRSIDDRWKIEYRALPQVPIRYGYFAVYLVLMPLLGISACTLCNFITVPRLFEAISGGLKGFAYVFSGIGLVNIGLLLLLGFFSSKGRAYCQFLCPIGAVDGLVNRLGAVFRFTRRVRVERSRCTGCNICARQCMTGAIQMKDGIAVVDQLSCMSCHECVDVCDWGAIDWRSAPLDETPKRKKKGVDFHPQPNWTAIHIEPLKKEKKDKRWRYLRLKKLKGSRRWRSVRRLGVLVIFVLSMTAIGVSQVVSAAERHPDPDGCFSCHALEGLDYIDKEGVLRSASIRKEHYYSSLHGSVPCKDCHRKIQDFPHRVENGEVDCSESCHVEEPSKGKPYTHKKVVEEFAESVHGDGWTKGFTGGNRLGEGREEQNPSCRQCHSNEPYISEKSMPKFKDAFDHLDTECGKCHQGEVWLGQFSGHLSRRFVGSRWDKNDHNKSCNQCHADRVRMAKVEIENEDTGEKKKVESRFVVASDSYAMTLHGRLLEANVMQGASCIDCHAPSGYRHGVLDDDDRQSATHRENLVETCAQSECHGFAKNPLNKGFVETDLHDLDMVPVVDDSVPSVTERIDSNWVKGLFIFVPVVLVFAIGAFWRSVFGKRKKGVTFSIVGGDAFQEKMLERKAKRKVKKRNSKNTYGKKSPKREKGNE
ncbi:MAG: 4Fe-4S binding protein [Gammaproteobacteria bacterium]|nr:4Fe-4S binding protein [Gammaproteobacteria bacterium]